MSETKTRTYKVLDTPTLIKANRKAVELEQNRSVTDEFLALLDPDGTHVIGFHMDHVNFYGTPGIRCNIHCKMKGEMEAQSVWIDVTHEEFNGFDTVDYP
jgi:hypothetical protein